MNKTYFDYYVWGDLTKDILFQIETAAIITIYNLEKSYVIVVQSRDQGTSPRGRAPKQVRGGRPWPEALRGQLR